MAKAGTVQQLFKQTEAALKAGDLATARKLYRKAARGQSKNGNVLQQIGYFAFLAGDYPVAIQYWRQVAALAPKNPVIYSQLGAVYRKMNKLEEAKRQHLKAFALAPDNPMICNNLGNTLRDLGETAEAKSRFQDAIRAAPDYAEAHANLGNCLRDEKDIEGAERCYRKAVELKPGYADAWADIGNIHREREEFDQAVACYRRAIEANPSYAPAYLNLASTRMRMGRLDGTEELQKKALQLDPSLAEAWSSVGNILHQQGKDDEAVGYFRKALEMKPTLTSPYLTMASIQSVGLNDEDIATLQQRLATEELENGQASDLHFALARSFEARKQYDEAFAHAKAANELDYHAVKFSAEGNRQFADRSIEVFDKDFFAAREGYGLESAKPILVLGLPRSGTTLVEQIIASHPAVFGAGELVDFPDVARGINELAGTSAPFPDNARDISPEASRTLAQRYLDMLDKRSGGAPHVTDKLPFNFRQLGLFHLLLPKARIVHCRRDPRDVAVSCYFIKFTKPISFAYNLDDFAAYYEQYVRLMDHWLDLFPDAIMDLHYEDLIADQEAKSREMIEFLGLPWDDACLNFHQNKREVKTASSWQVRQPVYKSSLERWRRYEKHLGPVGELAY